MGKTAGAGSVGNSKGQGSSKGWSGCTTAEDVIQGRVRIEYKGLSDGKIKTAIRAALTGGSFDPPINEWGWLRVSQVASLCPREVVLSKINGIDKPDPISPDLALVLEHGTALHWGLQNNVLPTTGTLFGRWTCMLCGFSFGGIGAFWNVSKFDLGHFVRSQVARPNVCPACGEELDSENCVYREQHFKDGRLKLSGHPDGFLVIPGMDGLGILEAKSISSRGAWEVRNTPKLDHAVQLQCYLAMTGLRWGKILYWNKGEFGMGALVEHTVEFDEGVVLAVEGAVKAIHRGIAKGIVPDKLCATRTCKRASGCSVTQICFGSI